MPDDARVLTPGFVVAERTARFMGLELRRLRRAHGWTRRNLRDRLRAVTGHDLSTQTLATYELGTRSLSIERLAAVCFTLGVRPADVCATVDDQVLGATAQLAATIPVDLRKVSQTGRADLAGVQAWALTQLDEGRQHAMLTPPAIASLAEVCGLEVADLTSELRAVSVGSTPTNMTATPTVETTKDRS